MMSRTVVGDERNTPLSETHLRSLLEGSSLREDIITSRGYRTVASRAELLRLGFSDRQCRVPALLLPVWNVHGEVATYQCRPDEPRVIDGRTIKYETPKGSRMILDIHPTVRPLLRDPSVPLFVTEGIKKGDALASRGLCAVALLGVWNWRGMNEVGGKTALADWEHIALHGRRVFIVFDSDVMQNPSVHAALARLHALLASRGAR
jgi:hypothetical protein